MERVYFIYSKDKKRDKLFVRDLHVLLPMHIDIIEANVKENRIHNSEGKEIGQMHPFILEKERPFCLTGQAYDELINSTCWDSRRVLPVRIDSRFGFMATLNTNYKDIRSVFYKMLNEDRIKLGNESISSLISELRYRPYSWPPK